MDLLKDLNSAQKEAVTFKKGPLLIVAGAGTGKTTVITQRIAYLIAKKKAKPEEILAVTFTEKASGEMIERVDKLLPLGYSELWIHTFHGFAEKVLKDYAIDIGLPNDFKILDKTGFKCPECRAKQDGEQDKSCVYRPIEGKRTHPEEED